MIIAARWLALGCAAVLWPAPGQSDMPQHNPFRAPDIVPVEMATGTTGSAGETAVLPALRATLVSSGAPLALVGERLMGVGDEADGFRLLAVSEGRAVFDKAGTRVEVRLAPAAEDEYGDAGETDDD